jgi:hypothetical protein
MRKSDSKREVRKSFALSLSEVPTLLERLLTFFRRLREKLSGKRSQTLASICIAPAEK